MNMQRIHILGAAGSGKTTLARRAAEQIGCPWHELDAVAYEGGYATQTHAGRAAGQPAGNYGPAGVGHRGLVPLVD
ncbi:MAG: hypothetical protein KDE46_28285 [Caldilineaceae bacterium]|nr:hypothetical protein [Caldilineaceae bacterium]